LLIENNLDENKMFNNRLFLFYTTIVHVK
jgi:hypothetical protein